MTKHEQPQMPHDTSEPEHRGRSDKHTPNAPIQQLDPIMRSGLKLDDLPYVNVVEAALVRTPDPGPLLLSVVMCALFASMLTWSYFAKIDEVTHAEGQVIPSRRTQIIQNLEGGILGAVLVKEGQIVETGTPLAQIDNKLAESQMRDAVNRIQENELAIIRLDAELTGIPPVFPKGLDETAPQQVQDQHAIYDSRMAQFNSEVGTLESQFEQRKRETEELISRKQQIEQSLAIAQERRNTAYPLMQRKIYSRMDFLELEQRVVSLQGELTSIESFIPKAESAADEAEQRVRMRKAERDVEVNAEISKRRTELSSLKETLSAGGDRVTRTELRSPVRGTVKQIYLNTVGGVVKPGEAIMEVVPLDDTLLVEARVRPADVAFLHHGQSAMVKVSAYDFSIYGGLEATLEQISADTIEGKQGEFYYLVKVRTQKNSIVYHNDHLPIIPGMVATVDILTGQKTVLDYLLKPILKARQTALRER